jgi:competence protein ComEC
VLLVTAAARSRAAGAAPAASASPDDRAPPTPRPGGSAPGTILLVAAAALLCAAGAAGAASLRVAELHRGPLPELAGRHAAETTVELTVTSDPRLLTPRASGARRMPHTVLFEAEAERVTAPDGGTTAARTPVLVMAQQRGSPPGSGGEDPVTGGVRRLQAAWLGLLPSTRLRVQARPVPPLTGGDRIAVVLRVTADRPPLVLEPPSRLQRAAGRLRAGLREATEDLAPDARALLPALVVGDTSRMTPELVDAFHATDLVHLTAVSGANLSIVLFLLIGPPSSAIRAERRGLAPRLGLSLRATALAGALLTVGFVLVCRPEPSVLRAAACGLITLLAIGTGRRRSLLPALATAVLLLVLYDPWLARSYGFLLSVLATGALLTVAPRWSAALRRRGVPGRLAEVLAAAAAAQAVCAPVVAVLAGHVSLVAIPCNLLAELAVAPATVLGCAALVTAPLAMPVGACLAWAAGWPARWIAGIARTGAALPGADQAWPDGWTGGLLLAAVSLAIVFTGPRMLRHPWLCAACALALLLAIVRPAPLPRIITGWPPPGWRLAVCDVGQGDALVLAAGSGRAVVVDAGPAPALVDRCLRALGVRRIPLIVLTHFHADHVAGLPGVLRGRAVGAIETTTLDEPADQAEFVRRTAADARIPVLRTAPGKRRLGAVTWEVLWPLAPPGPSPAAARGALGADGAAGDGDARQAVGLTGVTGANDASVTLLVRTAGLTLLLPGDLEPLSQRGLLAAVPDLPRVDVLKVAHHGAAFQDPGLLRRIRPRLALISCGEDNGYGHPSPRTVAVLRAGGAAVVRTDVDGAIAVTGTASRPTAVVRSGRGSPPGTWP